MIEATLGQGRRECRVMLADAENLRLPNSLAGLAGAATPPLYSAGVGGARYESGRRAAWSAGRPSGFAGGGKKDCGLVYHPQPARAAL
jgi:hypothetical protein